MKCANTPCRYCPYRRDVPSGVWSTEEYVKLFEYDTETPNQPIEWFGCHTKPDTMCTGWLAVGMNQPHHKELLALRLFPPENLDEFKPDDIYFSSGTEACEHGLRDIENPGEDAFIAMGYLEKMLDDRRGP